MRASERLGLDRAERTLHVLDAERCSGHAVLSRTKRVPVPMHRTDKKHVNSQTWSFLGLARVRTKQCRRQWAASGAAGPSEETEPAQRRHGGGGDTPSRRQQGRGWHIPETVEGRGQRLQARPGPGRAGQAVAGIWVYSDCGCDGAHGSWRWLDSVCTWRKREESWGTERLG